MEEISGEVKQQLNSNLPSPNSISMVMMTPAGSFRPACLLPPPLPFPLLPFHPSLWSLPLSNSFLLSPLFLTLLAPHNPALFLLCYLFIFSLLSSSFLISSLTSLLPITTLFFFILLSSSLSSPPPLFFLLFFVLLFLPISHLLISLIFLPGFPLLPSIILVAALHPSSLHHPALLLFSFSHFPLFSVCFPHHFLHLFTLHVPFYFPFFSSDSTLLLHFSLYLLIHPSLLPPKHYPCHAPAGSELLLSSSFYFSFSSSPASTSLFISLSFLSY